MRGQLEKGVALPSAQVISLADWLAGKKPKHDPKPVFGPTDRPGMDFNEMGRGLAAAAKYVRDGRLTAKDIAKLLEGLSVNARHACLRGHDMEFRLMHAERLLSPQYGNLQGKKLTRAIKEASDKLRSANRAKQRAKAKAERLQGPA